MINHWHLDDFGVSSSIVRSVSLLNSEKRAEEIHRIHPISGWLLAGLGERKLWGTTRHDEARLWGWNRLRVEQLMETLGASALCLPQYSDIFCNQVTRFSGFPSTLGHGYPSHETWTFRVGMSALSWWQIQGQSCGKWGSEHSRIASQQIPPQLHTGVDNGISADPGRRKGERVREEDVLHCYYYYYSYLWVSEVTLGRLFRPSLPWCFPIRELSFE